MQVRAVVLDVFGTLLKIAPDRRSPYLQLIKALARNGRPPHQSDLRQILTKKIGPSEFVTAVDGHIHRAELTRIECELRDELEQLTVFSDVRSALDALRNMGLKLALASNLSFPHACAVRSIFPGVDDYFLSSEIGLMKPDFQFYQSVLDRLNVKAEHVIFVGDTPEHDVDVPSAFGMFSFLLDRERRHPHRPSFQSLHEVLEAIALIRNL